MSLFSRLFGGKPGSEGPEEAIEYKDCRIIPEILPEGREYRLAARIEKVIGGETKVHQLIRADTIAGKEAVVAASVAKAKQVIDEQGDRLFR